MSLLHNIRHFFGGWWQRRRLRRETASRFERAVNAAGELSKAWHGFTPYNGFIRQRRQRFEQEFGAWRRLLPEGMQSQEMLQRIESRLQALSNQSSETRTLNEKWFAQWDCVRRALDEALELSASIRGREFQNDCNRDRRLVEKSLAATRKTRDLAEANNHFIAAQKHCATLRRRVENAMHVRVELPQFVQSVESFDVQGLVGDAGLERAYRLLRETADTAGRRLKGGQYESAALKLEEGGREFGQLRNTLQFRFQLVQREVDLWRADPDVCGKFDLERFAVVSTARQLGAWQETKPSIEKYVNCLAAESAAANLSDWPEGNWSFEEIEKFSLAVVAKTARD